MSECTRTEERLVELLDGDLAPPDQEALASHLASCAACRETARLNRAILDAYESGPSSDVSDEVALRVLASARESHARPRRRWSTKLLLAAAAALLFGLLLARALPGTGVDDASASIQALVAQGDRLREQQEPERAMAAYEQALEGAPEDEQVREILHRLAATLVELENFDRALAQLDALFARWPDDPERGHALLLRAAALEGKGAWDLALEVYQRIASDAPAEGEEAARRARGLELLIEQEALRALQSLGYTR